MLLLLIPLVILIIAISLQYLDSEGCICLPSLVDILVIVTLILSAAITLFSGLFTLAIVGSTPGTRVQVQQEYEAINYQIENEFYSNSNEVGKFEIIKEIREFNTAREQEIIYHNSLWTNWQVPIVYSAYPEIALPAYLAPGGVN